MTYQDVEAHLESSIKHCEESGKASIDGLECGLELYTQTDPPDYDEVLCVRCGNCGIDECVQHEADAPAKDK